MDTRYLVLGLMSGTSLDGVDMALCEFHESAGVWKYHIHYAETFSYSLAWRRRLSEAYTCSGRELIQLDRDYGEFLAVLIKANLHKFPLQPMLIASHGHTVFHVPENRYTLQVGHGGVMSSILGIPVVCDFRSGDVALGGQGAPLVPVGDKLLFGEYQACLNLGGFANISFDMDGKRKAFDICPANIVLNDLVSNFGIDYDVGGELGKKGTMIPTLLQALNRLEYYQASIPKSLGREWLNEIFIPVLNNSKAGVGDKLHTVYLHVSEQIAGVLKSYALEHVLVTGGGAKNLFLLELIREYSGIKLTVPEEQLVDYKEALAFAFLGVLNLLDRTNCYSSVTGAEKDLLTGAYYGIKNMKVGQRPLS